MIIKEQEFTKEGFLDYLLTNSQDVFSDESRRRWLKMYCFLVSDSSWKTTFLKNGELSQFGEVLKLTITEGDQNEYGENNYYAVLHSQGLLVMYTTATNAEYRKSLENRINRSRGITQLWIKPDLFQLIWMETLNETAGYVNRFTSRRYSFDTLPSKLRPNYTRRFNYTGDDASQTISELEEMYGVLPESVYMVLNDGLKIHLTNEGLFSAQEASPEALRLFNRYLSVVKEPSLKLRETSTAIKFEIEKKGTKERTFILEPAVINFRSREATVEIVESMSQEMPDFSFLDMHTETGSLSFTATVVDDLKGSVFDISMSENRIVVVPKFKTTFESFIRFYRRIVEQVDGQAEFLMLDATT